MNRKMRSIIAAVMVFAVVMVMGTVASSAASASGSARVMMDGKYIEFSSDSLPKNVSGRIMVPYRAIFEYLGLEVGYDQATKEISGKTADFTLKMKSGDKNITLVHADGTSETKTMDVAPYISGGRTFVPTRFVSEMLGYTVGWDSANKTVVIIDGDKIAADADKNFNVFMKLSELSADVTKPYEMNGELSADITAAGEKTAMSGKINGLVEGIDEEFNMDLKLDVAGKMQNINAKVKFDGNTGDMYIKAEGVTEKSQWMKFNLSSLFGDSGVDIQSLLQQSVSGTVDPGKLLDMILSSSAGDLTVTSYDEMKAVYDSLKAMIGDNAFKKSGNSYKASFDQNLEGTKISGGMTINVDSADKATDYAMNIAADSSDMKASMSIKGTALSTDLSMSMNIPDTMAMNLKLALGMKETDKHPNVSLPAGETAISIDQLFNQPKPIGNKAA